MADRGRIILTLLLILCLGTLLLFSWPLIYETIQPHSYGISVVFINEDQAKAGEIIHLQEMDVAMTPRLQQALLAGSSGTFSLNMDQYDFYRGKFPNYSRNVTGSRAYYDYQGTYFYLEFIQDNRQHL
jgi:hypothetical protein